MGRRTAGSPTTGPPGTGCHRPSTGWALPGLVDAHCHVGLDAHGPVDDATSEKQALTDRDAGTLLIRDAGSPVRHPLDRRPRGPAEDHPRRPSHRPHQPLHPQLRPRDRAGGPGRLRRPGGPPRRRLGQARRRLDRPRRRATWRACWPRGAVEAAIAEAHRLGARVTAHCFAEDSLRDLVEAGIDCIEHATGPDRGHHPAVRRARRRHRPDAGQHRHLPAARGRRRGQVPALVGPHAAAARAPLRHRARRLRRRGPRLRRHRRGRLARRTGWSAAEVAELVKAGHPAAGRRSPPRPGAPGTGSAAPASTRAPRRTSWSTRSDPRADVRVLAAPRRVVLRGQVVG